MGIQNKRRIRGENLKPAFFRTNILPKSIEICTIPSITQVINDNPLYSHVKSENRFSISDEASFNSKGPN